MGISEVAAAAAWRGAVALARIRSTPSDRKPSIMVEQLALSPEALPPLKGDRVPPVFRSGRP